MVGPLLSVIILAAGKGTRMKSTTPKVLHKLAGIPLVEHVIRSAGKLSPEQIIIVTGPEGKAIACNYPETISVLQRERLGTGHAVQSAKAVLDPKSNDVLILFGDTPLVKTQTLLQMVEAKNAPNKPDLVVAGFEAKNPEGYGRIICENYNTPIAIVEHKDATEQQRQINLCNGGMMLVSNQHLFNLIEETTNNNANGEYYLTDVLGLAVAQGLKTALVMFSEHEVLGINSRKELAYAESVLQERLRVSAMDGGATLIDPQTTFLSSDTVIEQDVVIEPNVFIGPGVKIEANVTIKAFCHLEQCTISSGSVIGPFARLRPGAQIGEDCRIGNFVEVKNSTFSKGAKANHLSYVGDSEVGEKSNIGAGTITANYDGFNKHRTKIGDGVFIGSNSSLVAPVTIEDGALVAAGSTITSSVSANSLAVTRAAQREISNGGERFRKKASSAKNKK
jgi:bifunctional UDP-N-acetylglucosamine pyrophosphorylase/glucosamine-1-phosphate N-acetyltransferase